jgi:hypothetical protein
VCPANPDWGKLRCAYAQLSHAYAEAADEAERLGWTVRRANLNHLAMVSDPRSVADLLKGCVD